MSNAKNLSTAARKSWELLVDFGFSVEQCHLWADSAAHLDVKQQEAIMSRLYGLALNVDQFAQCERELASRFALYSANPGDIARNIESIRHATERVTTALSSFRAQRDAFMAVLRFAGVKVEAAHFGGSLATYIDAN